MVYKILGLIYTLIIISSCGDRCKENADNARNNHKDTSLMSLWRYSDNHIRYSVNPDSGYFSFKPNGDFNNASQLKYISGVSDVWYTKGDTIYTTYCTNNGTPGTFSDWRYSVKKDTLFLFTYSTQINKWVPDTLIKVKEYVQ
jgi:hypothetical protein